MKKAKNKHKLDFDRLWKWVTVSRNTSGAESVDAESNVTRHRTSSIGTRKSNLSLDRVPARLLPFSRSRRLKIQLRSLHGTSVYHRIYRIILQRQSLG